MAVLSPSKIVPHLWYATEAARFHASLFPGSSVDAMAPNPADTPGGPAGAVQAVEFTDWMKDPDRARARRTPAPARGSPAGTWDPHPRVGAAPLSRCPA